MSASATAGDDASTRVLGTSQMCNSKLRKLAREGTATVYTHTYDAPEGRMSAREQCATLQFLMSHFDDACRTSKAATDEMMREAALEAGGARARKFQRLYPAIFANVLRRAQSLHDRKALDEIRKVAMHFVLVRNKHASAPDGEKAELEALAVAARLRVVRDEKGIPVPAPPQDGGGAALHAPLQTAGAGDGDAGGGAGGGAGKSLVPLTAQSMGACLVRQ